jgi:hypothetical protein
MSFALWSKCVLAEDAPAVVSNPMAWFTSNCAALTSNTELLVEAMSGLSNAAQTETLNAAISGAVSAAKGVDALLHKVHRAFLDSAAGALQHAMANIVATQSPQSLSESIHKVRLLAVVESAEWSALANLEFQTPFYKAAGSLHVTGIRMPDFNEHKDLMISWAKALLSLEEMCESLEVTSFAGFSSSALTKLRAMLVERTDAIANSEGTEMALFALAFPTDALEGFCLAWALLQLKKVKSAEVDKF